MHPVYITRAEAATYLGVSLELIDKNSIPMASERQQGKFRAVQVPIGIMRHVQLLAEDVYAAVPEDEGLGRE